MSASRQSTATAVRWSKVGRKSRESYRKILTLVYDIFCYKYSSVGSDAPFFKYNSATNTWSRTPAFFVNREAACLLSEDKYIYKIGGRTKIGARAEWVSLTEAQRLDPSENKWEKISPLRQATHSAGGAGAHGKVCVAGRVAAQTCEVWVASDELATHPGRVIMLPFASCHTGMTCPYAHPVSIGTSYSIHQLCKGNCYHPRYLMNSFFHQVSGLGFA